MHSKIFALMGMFFRCKYWCEKFVYNLQAITYSGRDIDAMKSVAQASHKRSLADFQATLEEYTKELENDVIVKAHLGTLYDTMLEQNLCRIIEPYSRVEVCHLLIDL